MLYALVFSTQLLLPMPDLAACEKELATTRMAYQHESYLDRLIACPDPAQFQCQRRA